EGGYFLGTSGSFLRNLGNNLFDWSFFGADIVGDPGISTSLGRNGGSTRSYSFIDPSTSPANDAGNNDLAVSGSGAALATDQRLAPFSRIVDGNRDGTHQIDIGAVEHHDLHVTSTADSVDGDYSQGEFTLREAVQLSELLPGTQTISFGTSGPVQLTNEIDISDSVIIAGNQTQIRSPALGNAFAIQSDNNEPNEYQFYNLRISGGESNLSGIVVFGADQGDRLTVRGSTIEGFSLLGAAGIADLSLPQVVQVELRDTNLRGNFYGLLA
ncbi:MAG: choice-of-anchor Q domain-containing protein, partial [Planctomycetota bacterium]